MHTGGTGELLLPGPSICSVPLRHGVCYSHICYFRAGALSIPGCYVCGKQWALGRKAGGIKPSSIRTQVSPQCHNIHTESSSHYLPFIPWSLRLFKPLTLVRASGPLFLMCPPVRPPFPHRLSHDWHLCLPHLTFSSPRATSPQISGLFPPWHESP